MNFGTIVLAVALMSCQALAYGENGFSPEIRARRAPKDGQLVKFLENFKETLRNGNSTLGIPIMDPFVTLQQTLRINEDDIDVKAVVTNVKVDGLSNYDVLKGDFTMMGIKATIRLFWPAIIFNSGYIVKGTAYGLNLYGNGDVSAVIKDLDVAMELKFSVKGGHLYVKQIASAVHLSALDFKITGLFGDEEISALMSSVISDVTPQLIDDYQDLLTDRLNPMVAGALDEILQDISLSDLLGMIS